MVLVMNMNNISQNMEQESPICLQSLSIRQRRYRSAVALNNIAIRLLELNCFSQAAEISYQATHLLKAAALNYVLRHMEETDGGEALTNTALKLLAHCEPQAKPSITIQVLTESTNGLLVRNDNQSPFTFEYLVSAQRSAETGKAAFPIRLEDSLVLDEPDILRPGQRSYSRSLALSSQSAIMFHNLGLACLYCSITTNSKKLLETAHKFLWRSYSLITKCYAWIRYKRSTDGDDAALFLSMDSVLTLLTVVMNSLILVLQELCFHNQALALYDSILEVHKYLSPQCYYILSMNSSIAPVT